MKKKTLILTLFFLVSSIISGYVAYSYYALPIERLPYFIQNPKDDTLRIAYIGDSWAAIHKEHECVINKIISDSIHLPVKVYSYGLHGKTSKEIYESIFDNYDMRKLIMQGCDFCFISAGINDTYKKMSKRYYKASMDFIIRFLLYNKVTPVILEIPDYNITKAYESQKQTRKIARILSMFITGTQLDCKTEYRVTLNELINEKKYQKHLSIIKYNEWNNNYIKDLQLLYTKDGMHLNPMGYTRLDSCIATKIINKLKDR